ncbi:DUF6600 domain-containing protein [Sphingobacterium spiritivorum]|uniref:Uncharacterized protein n=2 Tax=Sphingobacterium spiritivorum TaxID=258 RepID=D7VTS8_SPHSI|nr:DUF6600 domain-containing protein [Sphingobacterium spiritivorum]EFK55707.1 hypothetical protein HMPREF0766_14398 [Sphingobacterium spiritivorum ATCC 33861]WQD34999.1 DUF6600 domain-containing protein [Sphingobacterium spiritivorum]SUI98836.1 Uncharacterised protein [Sphingobacterium spiritivorum]
MKGLKKSTLFIMTIFGLISLFSISAASAQVRGGVSLDLFYDELSPYGNWDDDPTYGEVWYPDAGRDFRPYSSNGYWAMTEYGNTWVSDYPWGWAPFHYGRWVYSNYRGWGWIPGYEWGPAWVDWRSGNGYYGWAPMMPSVNVNINIGIGNLWVFLPSRYIFDRHFHNHYVHDYGRVYNRTTIVHNTYVVNNNHYYGGPSRRDMERSSGRSITVRNMRTSDRPGRSSADSRSVSIYRPDDRGDSRSSDRQVNRSSRESNRSNTGVDRGESRESNRGNAGVDRSRNAGDRSRNTDISSNRTDRGSRTLYIDKDGNATLQNGNNSRSRSNDNNGNTNRTERSREVQRNNDVQTSRPSERQAGNRQDRSRQREASTVEQNRVERQNQSIDRQPRSSRGQSNENMQRRESAPQNRPSIERGNSQPQMDNRGRSRSAERAPQYQQASTRASEQRVSTPAPNRAERGSASLGSSRSSRGR